jgi:NAD(P)-dependent dehydrogenase (short-subunit alcohol dehydrogenase family)
MRVEGSRIAVSGGASGLGRAVVERLARSGARVAVLDRDEAALSRLDGDFHDAVWPFPVDVVDETAVGAAFSAMQATWGALDGVVTAAGVLMARRLVDRQGPHPLAAFQAVLAVNATGTFNVVRLAAPLLIANRPGPDGERGCMVLTASIAAFEGQIGQVAYAASKGAVAAMVVPLARELGEVGVRVVGIAPGVFETPMTAGLPPEIRERLGAAAPFPRRLGHPEEFSALVLHVFSNPMLNGTVLRLDGGLRLGPR